MTVMKEPEIPAPSMNSNHDKPTGTVTVQWNSVEYLPYLPRGMRGTGAKAINT